MDLNSILVWRTISAEDASLAEGMPLYHTCLEAINLMTKCQTWRDTVTSMKTLTEI